MEDQNSRYGQQQQQQQQQPSGWSSDYPPPPHHPPPPLPQQNPPTGSQQLYSPHPQGPPPPHGPPPYGHGPPPYRQGAPPYVTGQGPPPHGHGPPHHDHGPPPHGHGPPPHGHGPPPHGHGPPPHGHGPPPHDHGPPPHGHGPPSHSYGPPPQQHGQRSHGYRSYPDSHGSRPHGYGQPLQGHGPAPPGYDPRVNERPPQQGYGHGVHGPPPHIHNQETQPEIQPHRTFPRYSHNQDNSSNIPQSEVSYDNGRNIEEQSKQSTDQSADQEWVNSWLTKNKINHRLKKKKQQVSTLKVPDARSLMREALSVTEDLQRVESNLRESLNDSGGMWEELIKKVKLLKGRLSEIKELMSESALEQVISTMSQIKNKRLRLKAKRKRCYREEQKKLKRREDLHRSIDTWRANILKKDEDKKKEKELKAAADVTLAEVRKKLHEAEKSRDLLMALTKLRQLRKDAAERKGASFSRALDKDFEERTEEQLKMLREQLSVYEAEKMTLEAMLEMEAEENREREIEKKKQKIEELERRKERTIKRILFGREIQLEEEDPMLPFRQYYEQADLNIDNLLQIRHEWDLFLVPPMSGGTRLPEGWVMPAEPTSDTWASVLKDRLAVT